MNRSSRRTPIRLITLKEAREIVRSKSSTNYKNTSKDSGCDLKTNLRTRESFQMIQTKSIENNLNLIQKAFAVKEAFTSPVKKSISPDKKSAVDRRNFWNNERSTLVELKQDCSTSNFLMRPLRNREPEKNENRFGTSEERCKTEVICFIKGLEKLRYKLLKSNNLQ
jgi:hypothetical protein